MLQRCISHYGYFPKSVILGENKKIITFIYQQYTKPLIILTRAVSQITSINTKFNNLSFAMSRCKQIRKYEIENIINLIESQYHVNGNQIISLIQWCNAIIDCTPLDKVKLVDSLWLNLTVCNFHFDVHHYNALLKVYIDNNYDFALSNFLMEMKDSQIHPDRLTYYMCIKYYFMKGNIDKAIELVQYKPNAFMYKSSELFDLLLMSHSKFGNIRCIDNILNIMANQNIKPTTDTHAAIICTYAKLNDIDKVKQIINTCHLHNVFFTNTHILTVIYTLAVNKHIKSIHCMYQYLMKTLKISNKEVQIILDILNTGFVDIAMITLSHIILKSNKYQHTNIMNIVLKHAVETNMVSDQIIQICSYYKYNREIYKKVLLISLYYSLLKDNNLSLALLRACKFYCTIKSHYFWPLLRRNNRKCDLDGVLNILDIMINEFNISPCIHTISNYILLMAVEEKVMNLRNLLIKCKVNETVINNAYVFTCLNSYHLPNAALYIKCYPGEYFYNILSPKLRKAAIFTNDVENFINISCKLLENTENVEYSTNVFSNDRPKLLPASMDKQLYDAMIEFPYKKIWFKKVLKGLVAKNIRLEPETIKMIHNFLYECMTNDVIRTLENLSKKMTNIQIN